MPEVQIPEYKASVAWTRQDLMSNCGLYCLHSPRLYGYSTDNRTIEAAYKAMADYHRKDQLNLMLSDNVANAQGHYSGDAPEIFSSGGFIAYLIRNRIGRVVASARMLNPNHNQSYNWSVIQAWCWTTPAMLENEERRWDGNVPKRVLAYPRRILTRPKQARKRKQKNVSTDW